MLKKIEIYINNKCYKINQHIDRKDKRRLRNSKKLANSIDFQSSRILKLYIRKKRKLCISHKNGISVIVNSKIKCGIDIEELKYRNFNSLAKIFAKDSELEWINNDCKRFYMIFCAKEAIIKLFNLNFSYFNEIYLKSICNMCIKFQYENKRIKCFYYQFENYLICIAIKESECLLM